MIPKSRGEYTYTTVTFGRFLGFVRFWSFCLVPVPMGQFLRAYEFEKFIIIGIAHPLEYLEARQTFDDFTPHCNRHLAILPSWMIMLNTIPLVAFIECNNSNINRIIQDIFTAFSIWSLFLLLQ